MTAAMEPQLDAAAVDPGSEAFDRRALLGTALRRSGVLAMGGVVAAAASGCRPPPDGPNFHLVRRLTYGVSGASLDRVGELGGPAWLDEQLAPEGLDHAALDAKLAAFPALSMTAAQLKAAYPTGAEPGMQLRAATVVRQVHSPAQVYERMVELWSDHLNVPIADPVSGWLKVVEDREVIRRHALGSFSDLLVASAQSPAMLLYLDNARSVAGAPNENYGRELLELHTVSVGGGYTEADVKAVARLLTGWTIDPATGLFRFVPLLHDPGPLTIMGWVRPTGGDPLDHGVAFLRWLARHPKTAESIARKVAVRFVGDNPDPALVSALAATYTANDTAIVPVLRTLVAHPAFAASARTRFRRPVHQAVAVLRAVGADLHIDDGDDRNALVGLTYQLGQVPFDWPAPNGYPDAQGAWLTTGGLLARWDAAGIACSNLPQAVVDWPARCVGLGGKAPDAVVDGIAAQVFHETVLADQREAILSQIFAAGRPATLTQAQVELIAPLVATMLHCTPENQCC